jgi:hypothetical protein
MSVARQLSFDDLPPTRGPKPVPLDPLLTAQQIIDHSGIGYHTLLREFRSGRLPALKVAGHWRVELSAYRAWLERQRYAPRAELDVPLAPSPLRRSPPTSPVGSLVRLRAIEEQESG